MVFQSVPFWIIQFQNNHSKYIQSRSTNPSRQRKLHLFSPWIRHELPKQCKLHNALTHHDKFMYKSSVNRNSKQWMPYTSAPPRTRLTPKPYNDGRGVWELHYIFMNVFEVGGSYPGLNQYISEEYMHFTSWHFPAPRIFLARSYIIFHTLPDVGGMAFCPYFGSLPKMEKVFWFYAHCFPGYAPKSRCENCWCQQTLSEFESANSKLNVPFAIGTDRSRTTIVIGTKP